MSWLALGLAIAIALLLFIAWRIWRRYIEPWREVDELVRAIAERRAVEKFLMTGNEPARGIGLSLEKIAARLHDLETRAEERDHSVQAAFGAMLDGLEPELRLLSCQLCAKS